MYAPNYHDNYFVDVVANYNVTLDIQEMTSEDFNSFITGMEKYHKHKKCTLYFPSNKKERNKWKL